MLLESSNLKLRAIEPEDLEILYKWENNTSLWIHGNTLSPYSKLALRQYINDSLSMDIFQNRQLRLMACLKQDVDTVVGTVDLYDFDPQNQRAGVGILIDEDFRGRKFASEVLQIIEYYAFNFLHLHQLYAYIATSNNISLNLFRKAGYQQAGLLKDWLKTADNNYCDVAFMQLIAKPKDE